MKELNAEVVRHGMLSRRVDSSRYRGVARPDKTVRWAEDKLEQVERLRGRPPEAWPTPTALPESLGELAELLTTLGWDDLAALANRERLTVYRELDAARSGVFSDEVRRTLAALFSNLIDLKHHEEALEVVDEQLRLSSTDRSTEEAEYWRMVQWRLLILARLGRREEAVEYAAVAVNEVRGRLGHRGDASADLELSHVLATYADQLDGVGRVAEAADVTAEVVAFRRERPDSTFNFATMVDLLSERLVRSERAEEAGVRITEAMREIRRREGPNVFRGVPELAATWHAFSARLLSLGLPDEALTAGEEVVNLYRRNVFRQRVGHRQLEAADHWDDDPRYDERVLLQERQRELESSLEAVHRAERKLHDALLTLSACLRRLDRVDEATAADAEAARISMANE
ncbi:hypothetical protein [Actinoallomurus vinaceus]|uniref:hypothetical protein n=1 Tax=Actinoallomurus vinaceus TaxID=1080074 RepID=UPI0031E820EC